MSKARDETQDVIDFENDLLIDRDNLDHECELQGQLMYTYQRMKAQARKELSKAEEKKKTIRSKLIKQARGKGGEKLLKVDKITDSIVEAWYRLQPEYQKAANRVIEKEYNLNMIEGAISGITDKKHGVQDLVQLYSTGYWSDIKAKGRDFKDKRMENFAEEQREHLKNKSKSRRSK